jgi:hypothetical protein
LVSQPDKIIGGPHAAALRLVVDMFADWISIFGMLEQKGLFLENIVGGICEKQFLNTNNDGKNLINIVTLKNN